MDLYFSLESLQHNKTAKLIFQLENLNYLSVNAVNSEHLSIKSFSNCRERERESGFKAISIHTIAFSK